VANNRVYLRFKATGHEVFLAKYYPSTGWFSRDYGRLAREIEKAFEAEHLDEYGLELAYESPEPGQPQATGSWESLVYREPDGHEPKA
jgi:hypothetical protein